MTRLQGKAAAGEKTESAFKSETENADTGRAGSRRAGWENAA